MLSNYDGNEYEVLSLERLRFKFGVTWQINYGNTPPNRRKLGEFTVKLQMQSIFLQVAGNAVLSGHSAASL